ncbi:hypothetical protein Syun_030207 [Stephania yunnanensis]|uniref:Late embryogenesis abundant protein LEA-2 subgroup domain-containing protein n=1 Tax=Stephania yunnanensis TaxID=152371 RepID=A0AAP0EA33_9MAGN
MTTEPASAPPFNSKPHRRPRRRSPLIVAAIATAATILFLFLLGLILYFTLFKPKDPTTTLISADVSGVAPTVSLPALAIRLNLTVAAQISVHNPNRASFRHAPGQSQVGEVGVSPGNIPARGSEVLNCTLVLEVEKFGGVLRELIGDVLAGEIAVDVNTRVPGRVTFLGIFRRHAVAVSRCQIKIGVPGLEVRQQTCSTKTKL